MCGAFDAELLPSSDVHRMSRLCSTQLLCMYKEAVEAVDLWMLSVAKHGAPAGHSDERVGAVVSTSERFFAVQF